MKNITLNILDEYAMTLTTKLVAKLYECKMHKSFEKVLNESKPFSYKMYLDKYTIADEIGANKTELIMHMNERFQPLMKEISYKIDSDGITFSSKDHSAYSRLVESLITIGFDGCTIREMLDKNY